MLALPSPRRRDHSTGDRLPDRGTAAPLSVGSLIAFAVLAC